jgi:hypothetical protein
VKAPISSSSELGVSSGSEQEADGWRKDSEDEANAERQYCAGLFTEDDGDEWVRCQKYPKWAQTVCANHRERIFVCDMCKK